MIEATPYYYTADKLELPRNSHENIGKLIRQKRKEVGLTMRLVSKRSGISICNLSEIETGKVSPTYNTLLKLAEAFYCKLEINFKGIGK